MFIIETRDRGKCWIATQDILKGTLLLEEDPIVWSGFKQVCFYCLKDTFDRKKCLKCCMKYCSRECAELDVMHSLVIEGSSECSLLEKDDQNDPLLLLHLRSILLRKDLKNLCTDGKEFNDIHEIYMKLCIFRKKRMEFKNFSEISKTLSTNLIGITRDLVNIGVGIYPKSSFLNHDCRENTLFYFKGSRINVIASRDLLKGEEITTRYVPVNLNYKSRMQEFKNWNFKCKCDLCLFKIIDPRDLIKCQNCDGITNENYVNCEFCKEELELDELEFLMDQKRSKSSKGLKRELENLEKLTNKSHESVLQVRQELIRVLQEENEIEELVQQVSKQIECYELIFQGRLSVEVAFLQDLGAKYKPLIKN